MMMLKLSLKYKKWLEEEEEKKKEGFNLTLIHDPELAEQNFKAGKYDLVLIGFRMSVVKGFDLYYKLQEISKNAENIPKGFRISFMTSSRINYEALAEFIQNLEKNVMFAKKLKKKFLLNMSIL